ncbi:hypothetical protein Tco_0110797 [Tanacetum coccineum]
MSESDSYHLLLNIGVPDNALRVQSGQPVMAEKRTWISVALDRTNWEVVCLRGTTLVEVNLVKGHELPTIVKVLPVGFYLNPTSVIHDPLGFYFILLVPTWCLRDLLFFLLPEAVDLAIPSRTTSLSGRDNTQVC